MEPVAVRKPGRPFPSTPVFLLLWIPIGFTLGTLVLLGPVRWWANLCRNLQASPRTENGGVLVMIGFLFILSGYAARIITNAMESAGIVPRIVIPIVVLAISGISVAAWMHPALMTGRMDEEEVNARFRFGPYPDAMRMLALKRQGYTIVSLLHPAVVPFEPKLLSDEKKLARKIGIPLVHVPMLPWISDNAAGLATIERLAADPTRRFYVHCYLGKDRVRVVRRTVERLGVDVHELHVDSKRVKRSLRDRAAFERGAIYRLGSGVYLTGLPTDEEFLSYVLSGEIRQVVAMLDLDNPGERQIVERERMLLKQHDMPFDLVETEQGRFDPRKILEAVRRVKQMPKPVLVHGFHSPSTGKSPWGDGFVQTFFSDRLSLPPTLFRAPLRDGSAEVVVPHVAMGPRPAAGEFRVLARRGVAECIRVGKGAGGEDARHAARAGMRWRTATRGALVETVRDGGPYYVYGSDAAGARQALERAYGKPAPIMTP